MPAERELMNRIADDLCVPNRGIEHMEQWLKDYADNRYKNLIGGLENTIEIECEFRDGIISSLNKELDACQKSNKENTVAFMKWYDQNYDKQDDNFTYEEMYDKFIYKQL